MIFLNKKQSEAFYKEVIKSSSPFFQLRARSGHMQTRMHSHRNLKIRRQKVHISFLPVSSLRSMLS